MKNRIKDNIDMKGGRDRITQRGDWNIDEGKQRKQGGAYKTSPGLLWGFKRAIKGRQNSDSAS